ncbi:DUF1997 domain-containing protein [Calothrix rhizosoleniae]|uniref:DUF1997 domain-containing protein n=1 Tax=Calothrix rhizosoleniae TaxID=888997 RepID=UPI000B49E370|nr:DUF1997 domain-containing protein [Calothrix rhizosoleniae]
MATKFIASQSVEISVPQQSIPIQHYLRQPQRLVNALAESSCVQPLTNEVFRLKMRPLAFMSLTIQPTVDMKVWAVPDGTVHLHSVGCEIIGIEYINHRFDLKLHGHLSPYDIHSNTYLQGNANLEVLVELPLPFSLTPKPILETTGNSLLKSVLLTIKQRLLRQLIVDYCHWVKLQTQVTTSTFESQEFSIWNIE